MLLMLLNVNGNNFIAIGDHTSKMQSESCAVSAKSSTSLVLQTAKNMIVNDSNTPAPSDKPSDTEDDQSIIVIDGIQYKINTNVHSLGVPDTESLQEYKNRTMVWPSKDCEIQTEIPSSMNGEYKKTGWQEGFVFSDDNLVLFYFYAGCSNLISNGAAEDSYQLVDAALSAFVGNRVNAGFNHSTYADRKAGWVVSMEGDTPFLLFVLLDGNHVLFLTACDTSGVSDQTLKIVEHSLSTLVISEVEEQYK